MPALRVKERARDVFMRVNMDSSVASDPRFKMLGRILGVTWREAVGSCFLVWLTCYDRRSGRLTVAEVDIASEVDGFAEALVSVGLAHLEAEREASASANAKQDETTLEKLQRVVVIHGVDERIEFLNKQREKGSKGGKSSGKARRNHRTEKDKQPEANREADASRSAQAKREAYSLTHALALTPALAQTDPQTPAPPSADAVVGSVGSGSAGDGFDPLRQSEQNRKEFLAEWNGSGLKPLQRLTHTLHARLDALMLDPDWRAIWRQALRKAGQCPFLAKGEGSRAGPLDPSQFLRDDDFADKILRGTFDPRPVAAAAGTPTKTARQLQIEAKIAEHNARKQQVAS